MSEKPCGAYFFAFFENFFVPILTSGGLAAVSASAFAALYSAFGKYDVVHIHAEGPAFFAWLPKMFGKRVVVTVHGIDWQREKWQSGLGSKFIHQGEKNAAKYADEVIVLSKGVQDYLESGDLYGMIVSIIKTMLGAPVIMVVVLLTMIAFYATSFDSIALTASCYSYHTLKDGEQPNKGIQLMWCILLILLPIALLFAESSMNNLQSVSIVAAFPIGVVIVMIAVSFMKDAKKYMESLEESAKGKSEK